MFQRELIMGLKKVDDKQDVEEKKWMGCRIRSIC